MKIRLVCVGKCSGYLAEGVADFTSRVKRYIPFETVELKEEKGGKKGDPAMVRNHEGERILARLSPDAFVIVLDERGKPLDSPGFAQLLEQHMLQSTPEVVLVIGGAYGLSEEVKKRADKTLSLSAMTLTHQMARLFAMEQLYRGFTILRNEPYHNT